jgi:hypothetical protein
VWGAVVLGDGRFLSWAGGLSSTDNTLRLWASDGAPLAVLAGHTNRVNGALALSDGRLLSWSEDGTLRLWAADGASLAVLDEAEQSDLERIRRWAAEYGFNFDELADPANALGQGIGKVGNKTIVLYRVADGNPISSFYADAQIHAGPVFSADGTTIVAGDESGRMLFLRWRDR